MVEKIQYRWDFIGLSTDTKPTPETNDRVANGSTFYCSDNSKLYVWYKDQWYEKTVSGGGGGGTSNFNQLSNRPKYNGTEMTGSTDIPEVKTYTAGSNVSISSGNVISATDTTYSDFTGTDGTVAGTAGLVPAPATTDAGKFLKADGTWDTAGGGGGVTVVQTTGSSTTDVMSQNATTSMVFDDPGTNNLFRVGTVATPSVDAENIFWVYPYSSSEQPKNKSINIFGQCAGEYAISLGTNAITRLNNQVSIGLNTLNNFSSTSGIAIGSSAQCLNAYSVAIGKSAKTTRDGEFNIGAGTSGDGYNSTDYRVLGGVHDGQLAQDAVTVSQVNATIDAINTALSTNIPHIGAAS